MNISFKEDWKKQQQEETHEEKQNFEEDEKIKQLADDILKTLDQESEDHNTSPSTVDEGETNGYMNLVEQALENYQEEEPSTPELFTETLMSEEIQVADPKQELTEEAETTDHMDLVNQALENYQEEEPLNQEPIEEAPENEKIQLSDQEDIVFVKKNQSKELQGTERLIQELKSEEIHPQQEEELNRAEKVLHEELGLEDYTGMKEKQLNQIEGESEKSIKKNLVSQEQKFVGNDEISTNKKEINLMKQFDSAFQVEVKKEENSRINQERKYNTGLIEDEKRRIRTPTIEQQNLVQILEIGNQTIENNRPKDYEFYSKLWNGHIENGGWVTIEMSRLYNNIQQTNGSPLRKYKKLNENEYRIGYYSDLAEKLEKLINERSTFPTKFLENWLIQSGKIEGKKPFLEFEINNRITGNQETWFLPNRKYHWNKDYAYTYSISSPQNKERAGAGMIANYLMKEYPVIDDNTKYVRNTIVEILRKEGYSGHTKNYYWFKTLYRLEYDKELINEVFNNLFWHKYHSTIGWRKPSDIARYSDLKKIIAYYENTSERTLDYSKDLIQSSTLTQSLAQENFHPHIGKKGLEADHLGKIESLSELTQRNNLLKTLNQDLAKEGLQIKSSELIENLRKLRKISSSQDLGFIGINGKWSVELDWHGLDVVKDYMGSLTRPIKGFRIWAEILTDRPLYSENGKRLFYTIDLKDSFNFPFLAKYLNKKLLVFNSSHMFGYEIGHSRTTYYSEQTVGKFLSVFVEKLNFPKTIQKEAQGNIIKEFIRKYNSIFSNFRKDKGRAPTVFVLKYEIDKIKNSWIKEFHIWKNNQKDLIRFKGRRSQQVIDYFNNFSYSPSLLGEPIDYLVSISHISYEDLVRKVENQEVKSIHDISEALIRKRTITTQVTSEYIGTKDVQPPLIIDTSNAAKFKDESNPHGQVTIVQTLFQKPSFINTIKKLSDLQFPIDSIYEYKGQSRRKGSTTTIYEDVSSIKDRSGQNLAKNVNIFIKNSSEQKKIRIIEDYFKILYSPSDSSIFTLIKITHPDDLPIIKTELPKSVVKALDTYNEGRPVGWIDIGLFKGDERFSNLSQVYGAVKNVREKMYKQHNRVNQESFIDEVIKKLNQHKVENFDKSMVIRMNNLFEDHDIRKNTREINYEDFTKFIIDFVQRFMDDEKK